MNKRYNITDSKTLQSLEDYYNVMIESGFAKLTAKAYVSAAARYINDKHPLDREKMNEYFGGLTRNRGLTRGQRGHIYAQKAGVSRYIDFLAGVDLVVQADKSSHRPRKRCNKDCFNCIYPDCIFD